MNNRILDAILPMGAGAPCIAIIISGSWLLLMMLSFPPSGVQAIIPPHNPPWPPTYNMSESLITMQCNSSGLSSPARGAQFGIVSYDWSNMKQLWATSKPMACEELLVQQAVLTKRAGAKHVFVYRNIVKALPWFRTVREKLDDERYAGFFLKFDVKGHRHHRYHVPAYAVENATKCSIFYHDQEQTPQVPTTEQPHPDGSCVDYCDCGSYHPCGEYLFDHRNGTMLRKFLIKDIILGETAVGNDVIDGVFLDDYYCSTLICERTHNKTSGCPCDDPVQGPTEIDRYAQVDMGLSDQDIADITVEWNKTMSVLQTALLEHGAYTWSLIPGQENANASPVMLPSNKNATECKALLKKACRRDSLWQHLPLLFGFTVVNGTILAQLNEDLAFFLLARGLYAWAGWGTWGMTWPFNAEPSHGQLPPLPNGVPLPEEFVLDYGEPLGTCTEDLPSNPGVFIRPWTRAQVRLDCNSFQGNIVFNGIQQQHTS